MTKLATALLRAMTMRDAISIFQDLDSYIEKGGTLLDLPLLSEIPEAQRSFFVTSIGPDIAMRWGRCVMKIADLSGRRGSAKDLIGKNITEDDARRIWRETK
jgi:hypothetical protein